MKKQIINAGIVGGTIGSIIFLVILLIINRFVPLQTQDMLTFVILVISIVIGAYTILGASVLSTSWNDIDERSEKIVAKYEEKAKEAVDRKGEETQHIIIQDINQKQQELSALTRQYIEQIKQGAQSSIKRQGIALAISMIALGTLMVINHFKSRKEKANK